MTQRPDLTHGTKVKVICKYKKLTFNRIFSKNYHLLEDVCVDGEEFRDHCWIPQTKRLATHDIEKGDILCFTAKIKKYLCPNTLEKNKVGFEHIRNIEVIKGGGGHDKDT